MSEHGAGPNLFVPPELFRVTQGFRRYHRDLHRPWEA